MNEVRVAMLGFGGIAQSHKRGYELLEAEGAPIRLVAICDVDASRFETASATNLGTEKRADLTGIQTYTDADAMLAEYNIYQYANMFDKSVDRAMFIGDGERE